MKATRGALNPGKTTARQARHKALQRKFGERAHFTLLSAIALAACALLITITVVTVAPKRYSLQAGEVAGENIKATKDIEDTVNTALEQERARLTVERKYKHDQTITSSVYTRLREDYAAVTDLRRQVNEAIASYGEAGVQQIQDSYWNYLLGQMPVELEAESVKNVLLASDADYNAMTESAETILDTALRNGIRQEQLDDQLERVLQEISATEVAQQQPDLLLLAQGLVKKHIQANMIYDEAATEEARAKAAQSVQPVMVLKGQNVVREGEIVTEAQMKMLDDLGLIASNMVDWKLYIGTGLLVILLLTMVISYIVVFEASILRNIKEWALLFAIITVVVGVCALFSRSIPALMPVAYGALCIAMLLHFRLAVVVNVTISVLVGIMVAGEEGIMGVSMSTAMMVNIIGGTMGVYLVRYRRQRSTLVMDGVVIGAANAVSYMVAGLMTTSNLSQMLLNAAYGFGSGVLAAILCLGTMPLWEMLFGLVTDSKLMELANPGQPLLRRLQLEAPGTYSHSLMVANLSECAAEAVGANALLARVGAYYHDVGKLENPFYFKENQMSEDNPHDHIGPEESARIILAHPADGVRLMERQHIPKLLQDLTLQHHGDTPVVYFYHAYIEREGEGAPLTLNDFRYPGPRPQTKEAGILMLADTVEAAVRSMPHPTPQSMREAIRNLVRGKLEDDQLDDCPLSIRDLNTIEEAFYDALKGMFHERIAYPKVDIKRLPEQEEEN